MGIHQPGNFQPCHVLRLDKVGQLDADQRSTIGHLDPGVDPIAEADRRGSIMAILRIGNLDLQLPGQGASFGREPARRRLGITGK